MDNKDRVKQELLRQVREKPGQLFDDDSRAAQYLEEMVVTGEVEVVSRSLGQVTYRIKDQAAPKE